MRTSEYLPSTELARFSFGQSASPVASSRAISTVSEMPAVESRTSGYFLFSSDVLSLKRKFAIPIFAPKKGIVSSVSLLPRNIASGRIALMEKTRGFSVSLISAVSKSQIRTSALGDIALKILSKSSLRSAGVLLMSAWR